MNNAETVMVEPDKEEKVSLSARVIKSSREILEDECALRGHTLSEAVDYALRLGIPEYLACYPKRFEHVVAEPSLSAA
jgi:hypothetical protein